MTDEIWGLTACDTCRKARAAMPRARFRDVRAEPLAPAEIGDLLARFGDQAINHASTTFRALPENERSMPLAQLLARYPALMKRPVIFQGGSAHLGFTPAVRAALGLG